jgi:RNA polymerase sigma-70 factor (ECF subfamily)
VIGARASSSVTEERLLESACRGDEEAFRLLVDPHRTRLRAHCYRMLGSPHDADDALQDALLRAWRGLPGFDGRSAFSRWLYRITTNVCLDSIAKRPRRVLPIDYGAHGGSNVDKFGEALTEPMRLERYSDERARLEDGEAAPEAHYEQRETVESAIVAVLQHLAPRQRAVLILREVLGLSAREVSRLLGTTVVSVNSALQRARKAVDERLSEESQQPVMRSLGRGRAGESVRLFVDALERGDAKAIVALLAEDVGSTAPPYSASDQGCSLARSRGAEREESRTALPLRAAA